MLVNALVQGKFVTSIYLTFTGEESSDNCRLHPLKLIVKYDEGASEELDLDLDLSADDDIIIKEEASEPKMAANPIKEPTSIKSLPNTEATDALH